MHVRAAIFSLCLTLSPLAPVALAQPAPVTPIERANADAVAKLYARIAAEEVGNVPVSQIVSRVDGFGIVMSGLGRAEQIGGPREVAENVYQVRLSISGQRAAQLVLQAVAVKPDRSPVPPDRLAFLLKAWGDRTFSSTGDNVENAVAAGATTRPVEALAVPTGPTTAPVPPAAAEPPAAAGWKPAPAWALETHSAAATAASVGSPLRTARAAEMSARKALFDKVSALSFGDNGTIADAYPKRPDVVAAVNEAVNGARVAGIDYRADGSVEVRVAITGQRLWQRLAVLR